MIQKPERRTQTSPTRDPNPLDIEELRRSLIANLGLLTILLAVLLIRLLS